MPDEADYKWLAEMYEKTMKAYQSENAKLRELVLGLKWCCENYGCNNLCPLYDKSEQDHCREDRLLSELGMEVD